MIVVLDSQGNLLVAPIQQNVMNPGAIPMEIEFQILELTHDIPGQAACESRHCIWPLLVIHVHVGTAISPMPHCLWRNRSSVLAVSREFIALGVYQPKVLPAHV
jgi:hypothetical protein